MLFVLGQTYLTRGVNDLVKEDRRFEGFVYNSLRRHAQADWGDVCSEDSRENNRALNNGDRLFSAYKLQGLPTIWIITEADRSATTILFPEEY